MKNRCNIFVSTILMSVLANITFGASIQELASSSCRPYGISADGSVVVGDYLAESRYHAFRWTQSQGIVNLESFDGGNLFCTAYDISDDGSTIVGLSNYLSGSDACVWKNGQISPIDESGNLSYGYGVSADGSTIVGYGYFGNWEGYYWQNGTTTRLGSINNAKVANILSKAYDISADGSVIVGEASSPAGIEAFRWSESEGMVGLGDLRGKYFGSTAKAVSADGSVIVGYSYYSYATSGSEAFRWENGDMIGLGELPTDEPVPENGSMAYDVSGDGTLIVGTSNDKAFIWDEQHGMRDMKEFLMQDFNLDLTDWYLTSATAISSDGTTIIGQGFGPNGGEGWIAVIPEPTTLLLFGIGSVMIRRR